MQACVCVGVGGVVQQRKTQPDNSYYKTLILQEIKAKRQKGKKKKKKSLKSCWHDSRRLRNLAQKRWLVCFLKVPQLQSVFLTIRNRPLPTHPHTHVNTAPLGEGM